MITEILTWITGIAMTKLCVTVCRSNALRYLKIPYESIPDAGHMVLPRIHLHSPDFLLAGQIFISWIPFDIGLERHIFFQLIKSHGIILILRSLVAPLTMYPTCMPQISYSKCSHDLMFSGHTSLFIFLWAPWILLLSKINQWEVIIGTIMSSFFVIAGPMSCIASRQHYSSDVAVSAIISLLMICRIYENNNLS